MTSETAPDKPTLDPEVIAEAETYKNEANEFFKSELI